MYHINASCFVTVAPATCSKTPENAGMHPERTLKDALYEQVARMAKAMAGPKRLELIELLCQAPKSVELLAREVGISVATFYKWKAKFGGMEVSDARRLKALEQENTKLKRIVADQVLDIQALKEIARGNF